MAYTASAYGPWVGGDDWRAWVGVTKTSDTATSCTLKVEAWAWSQYGTTSGYSNIRGGVAHGNNGWDRGSATSISTNSWKKLYEKSYTVTKTTGSQTVRCWALAEGISGTYSGSSSTASVDVTVSAKTSYAISYNANGHGTAPASQTKWHGTDISLRGAISATGFAFRGWNTQANGGGTAYAAGATYSANAAATLYAQWQAVTYPVTYSANGGSGAPASQQKTHGSSLTLSSTRPTRNGYAFLGWATSASATAAAYQPGATYTGNAALSLYAVWKLSYAPPTITDATVWRCDSGGTAADDGTYALVNFVWAVDTTDSGEIDAVTVRWRQRGTSPWTGSATVAASGASGSVSGVVGGSFAVATSYDVQAVVSDSHGSTSTATMVLSPATFTLELLAGGAGVAIGKAATRAGLDVAMPSYFSEVLDATGGAKAAWLSVNNNAAAIASTGNATVNNLQVNGTTTHGNQVKFSGETALPSAGTSTDFFATGINAFSNGGRLAYKGLGDMRTWLGHEDTNWAYLVGNASASSYLRYRKKAGIVFVEINLTSQSLSTSTRTFATLPAGYRPSRNVSGSGASNTNNVPCVWVEPGGAVKCYMVGGTGAALYAHISFPV